MKMNSKLRRINIEPRSAYETTKLKKLKKEINNYTKEDLEKLKELDEYHRVIFPWK